MEGVGRVGGGWGVGGREAGERRPIVEREGRDGTCSVAVAAVEGAGCASTYWRHDYRPGRRRAPRSDDRYHSDVARHTGPWPSWCAGSIRERLEAANAQSGGEDDREGDDAEKLGGC